MTYLGVLEKQDYGKIVGQTLKRELAAKVLFLKNFRLFRNLSNAKI